MRRSAFPGLFSGLILCLVVIQPAGGAAPPAEADGAPVITQTSRPEYPAEFMVAGPRKGEADVAVAVDSEGKLQDVLVVGYTRKPFADESVAAIKTWKFSRPRGLKAGQTWVHVFRIAFQMERLNVVIYSPMTHPGLGNLRDLAEDDKSLTYKVCRLRELDRIPRPVKIVAPEAAAGGTVDVHFYIDEKGQVRMPAVREASGPALIASALAAVREWRFEPPLRDGTPALVSVDQIFHFEPVSKPVRRNP